MAIQYEESWQRAHSKLHADLRRQFNPSDQAEIRRSDRNAALTSITSGSDFRPLFRMRYWMASDFEAARGMIPELILLLSSDHLVGLTDSADVIIWERIESGDLKFYGHGWVIDDDLFIVGGRASWLLKELTGQDFGSIRKGSPAAERSALAERWQAWLSQYDCSTGGV